MNYIQFPSEIGIKTLCSFAGVVRISFFYKVISFFCLTLFFQSVVANDASPKPTVTFYPELWDWKISSNEIPSGSEQLALLENGDVLVLYAEKHIKIKKMKNVKLAKVDEKRLYTDIEYKGYTLFGNRKLKSEKTNFELLRGAEEMLTFDDGTTSKIIKTSSGEIEFSDESTIRMSSATRFDCYRGPANHYFSKIGSDGEVIWRKVIFSLLEKPRTFSAGTSGDCPEGIYPVLVARVESLEGVLLKLNDGTFLIMSTPMIYRFDKNLKSKSRLTEVKLFEFDFDGDILPAVAMKKNKDYWPGGPGSPYLYQDALDDLFDYLVNSRKKNDN